MPTIIDGSGSADFHTPLPIGEGGTGTTTGFSDIVPSMVRVQAINGYGITNTVIRRFTTVVTNQGTDITYADSATLGASFTINTNGVYAISYVDQFNQATTFGISLNSTQLTTALVNITASAIVAETSSTGAQFYAVCATTIFLPAGSVLRAHTTGTASGANPNTMQFAITRVA